MADADKGRIDAIYPALIAFLVLVAAARTAYIGFSAAPIPFAAIHWLIAGALFGAGWFFTSRRHHPAVGDIFKALGLVELAFTGAFSSAALIFHTGRDFPFVDAPLVAFDRALGLDWVAYVKWMDAHPFVSVLGSAAYESIFTQPVLIILVLVLVRQTERVYGLVAMMVVALTVTSAAALFLPALGPYQFFNLSPSDHPHMALMPQTDWVVPIAWLRSATFDTPAPPLNVGLISFPSYHAATAILYVWAAWRTPFLKWIVLALNVAMLLATPVHGSHYFVDVIAGIAVAVITIAAVKWAFERVARLRPLAVAARATA
jgi:membrane-associated phospholipid phosphatase